MKDEPTWQTRAVEQLSQMLDREPDVRAFILSGSLSAATSQADVWSDVDTSLDREAYNPHIEHKVIE